MTREGFEPPTYRSGVDCATVAPTSLWMRIIIYFVVPVLCKTELFPSMAY